MRERADLEKGALEVRSQIGKGTEVRVTFDF
jgi:signal transduction histidine kinase